MDPSALLFYILAGFILAFGLSTVLASNPIYSALSLAVTMIGLAFMFYTMNAHFIAGVQLIVYAGAVMVLFVMVLMLFDLKKELRAFSRGFVSSVLKITSVGVLCGVLMAVAVKSAPRMFTTEVTLGSAKDVTQNLARMLFTQYLFAFEALGLLLLLVAVGVVAVSRIKGGTHAKS